MFWLILLFIVAPLVELWVIIQVANVVGAWETIALLIIESAIGAWLLKRQGVATLARFSAAIDEGRMPSNELIDGFLLIIAGALMLAPGFIGDILGFLLIIPISRRPFRAVIRRRFRLGTLGKYFGMATSSAAGTRFVGTFRAGGGAVFDTTGSGTSRVDSSSGELGP